MARGVPPDVIPDRARRAIHSRTQAQFLDLGGRFPGAPLVQDLKKWSLQAAATICFSPRQSSLVLG